MSRCYLDTNFLYAHLRGARGDDAGRVADWRDRMLAALEGDSAVISGLVLDELAYRLVLAWLRDDGEADPLSCFRAEPTHAMTRVRTRLDETWTAIDLLRLELQPTDRAAVDMAKSFMTSPGLAPRDAFHAAHALQARCALIASADEAFAAIAGLELLRPAPAG